MEPDRTRIPLHHARYWEAGDPPLLDSAVKVFFSPKTYIRVCKHAHSDLDNEIGGWLLGRWCWDEEQLEEFIVIDATLPAEDVIHSGTFLTFTSASQVQMLEQKEERFPDKVVVGWYHTHPKMSLFLSSHDLWLHKHFFPHPWQVALVIEPHARLGGFFIRDRDHQLDSRHHYGFYELTDPERSSVVHWQNLNHVEPAIPGSEELE